MSNINYWIEETDKVWIKVPVIPEGESKLTIKKEDGFSPDGYDTFPFFEDGSEDTTSTPTNWAAGTIESNYSGSSNGKTWRLTRGQSRLNPISSIRRNGLNTRYSGNSAFSFLSGNFELVEKINSNTSLSRPWFLFLNDDDDTNQTEGGVYRVYYDSYGNLISIRNWDVDTGVATNIAESSYSHSHGSTWSRWSFQKTETHFTVYRDGTQRLNETRNDDPDDWDIITDVAGATHASGDTGWVQRDYVFMRKFYDDDLTITVTDEGDYYEVTIDNEGDELEDCQISVEATDLDGVTNNESLRILGEAPSGWSHKIFGVKPAKILGVEVGNIRKVNDIE